MRQSLASLITVLSALTMTASEPHASEPFIPLKWLCADGSAVSISADDLKMTVMPPTGKSYLIPYSVGTGFVGTWVKDGDPLCERFTGACAVGGGDSDGADFLMLMPTPDSQSIKCEVVK